MATRRVFEWRAVLYAVLVLATMPAWALTRGAPMSVGAFLFGPSLAPSPEGFAALAARLAYALVPWTPLAAFALVRRGSSAFGALAILALLASTIASRGPGLFVHGALAACVGSLLADLDRATSPAALLAIGIFAVAGLVAHDLSLAPDRLLDLVGAAPAGHASPAARAVRSSLGLVAAATATLLVGPSWLGRLRTSRGAILAVAGLAGALYLRVHAYPELVAQISPRRALDSWRALRGPGDELTLLGIETSQWSRSGGDGYRPARAGNAESAARWLLDASSTDSRRFVAMGPAELPRLNAAFRERSSQNLPIVGGSGAFLLGVDHLATGERSDSPLDSVVRSSVPMGLHPIEARLGDALDVTAGPDDGHGRVALGRLEVR